jgi:hypothetical protein
MINTMQNEIWDLYAIKMLGFLEKKAGKERCFGFEV